jgi:hypothetical protein
MKTSQGFFLLFDEIVHNESTGHLGLVFTQLCGPSVFEYAIGCPGRRLPWKKAKRIITDTITCLHFLHGHGIGNGGEQAFRSATHDTDLWYKTSNRAISCSSQIPVRHFTTRIPCYDMRRLICES